MKQRYNLRADKVPTGTPLNKKHHLSEGEKSPQDRDATPGRLSPVHPTTSVCNPSCWWHVCISGRMLLPEDPMGTSPKPQQLHTSTYTKLTGLQMRLSWWPRDTPRFKWKLAAHYQSWCTAGIPVHISPWGLIHNARRGCDPAACKNPPSYRCSL